MVGTKKGRSGVEWMVFTDLAGTHRVRAPLEMPPCTSPPHRPSPVLSYCKTLCTCHDESRGSGFGKWVHPRRVSWTREEKSKVGAHCHARTERDLASASCRVLFNVSFVLRKTQRRMNSQNASAYTGCHPCRTPEELRVGGEHVDDA